MSQHYFRGQLLLSQGRFEQAVEELRQAVVENAGWSDAHATLALALHRAGRQQEALKTVDAALEADPNNAFAHWMMALLRVERGELKAAEAAARKAIALDSSSADNHGLLSRILCEGNRFAEALTVAETGLALDASDDMCLTFRARALMGLGRKDEADAIANRLLQEDPDDAWNHCLRGEQLLKQGDAAGARIHYLEALRIDPRNAAARSGLATSLKARSFIYGVLLKFLLWLGSFRNWALWAAMIGLFLVLQFGDKLVLRHPDWLVPYEAAKALFSGAWLLVVLANPLFDLLLRFDRDGRHALTDDGYRATNWYLPCIGLGALCLAWMAFSRGASMPRGMAMAAFLLTWAVSQVFESTPGYVRRRLATFTLIAGALLVLTPVLLWLGVFLVILKLPVGIRVVQAAIWMPLAVMLYGAFADNVREWLERRRPDEE